MFSSLFRPGTHDIQFETIPRNGVFDAVASVIVNDSDLEDSTKFECELKIPETNYTVKKTVILTLGKYLNCKLILTLSSSYLGRYHTYIMFDFRYVKM
jgi:hypothetical protein